MPKVAVVDINGKQVGEYELSENIFGQPVNASVLHEVVKAHLANCRQGTQSALTRAEVSGGGIKPWRQKGTGRARQGSTRSPQWRHGGVVFAPKPRDYRMATNKKLKGVALRSALSSKVVDEKLVVVDEIMLAEVKTREVVKALAALSANKALIVTAENDADVVRAARNIEGVEVAFVGSLNTYEILRHDTLVMTQAAVEKVEEVYA